MAEKYSHQLMGSNKSCDPSAELRTSGKSKFTSENRCKGDLMDRQLSCLRPWNVPDKDRQWGALLPRGRGSIIFAILGDAGINQVVEKDFFGKTPKRKMGQAIIKNGQFTQGSSRNFDGWRKTPQSLPYDEDSRSKTITWNEISFGQIRR